MNIALHSETFLRQQESQLRDAVSQAIELATKAGASAEVAVTKVNGLSVSTRLSELENIELNNDGALGISVYLGQQKGNASTSDLSPTAIKHTLEAALAIAKHTSPDECAGLADKELLAFDAPDLDLYHDADIDFDMIVGDLIMAEEEAMDSDPRVVNSEGAAFNSHRGVRVYGNSHGMLQSYLSSRYSLSCSVIAQQGEQMEREGEYTVSRRYDKLKNPLWVGLNSGRKAVSRLDPHKLATQKAPVIFLHDVATGLISHLAAAISGGNLYRQSSFLLDQLGRQILPDWFQIDERPHLLGHLASTPFDSEGGRTVSRSIIDQGILQTYLLTSYSGRKLGMQSTGHAGGIHNWQVASTVQGGLETLFKQMDTGLVVTDLMGQAVNMVTGDYSRGASGFWIEDGELQYPVAEITIAGRLQDMLRNIVAVSDDVETRSNIQTGSILLEEMQISGN